MLGQITVALRTGASEIIERQAKPVSNVLLDLPHIRTKLSHWNTSLRRCQLCRCAMLVGCTDKHNVMPPRSHKSRIRVRGQLAAHQVPEVFDTVNIRQRRSDKNARHMKPFVDVKIRLPQALAEGQIHFRRVCGPRAPIIIQPKTRQPILQTLHRQHPSQTPAAPQPLNHR